ncbi:membrane protein [Arenicella chitinivorans]|uniref:Membrane protein n=1 Tax=Arenicella chitinivorans TaxID=1329800 RepID=A0A918RQY4_9GAMM|nr:DMT family transporter [Arenicella chitinivorans]GHA08805.1 membrane protein [Arenicella chitinivorans]
MNRLSTTIAVISVILIWSTTPLAIQWSSVDAPLTSALLRMLIGVLFCGSVVTLLRQGVPMHRPALTIYLVGGVTTFLSMTLFYAAAQRIPSGWIAVLFGLSPLMTGAISALVEPETRLTPARVIGLLLGLGGLYLVFSAGLNVEQASLGGVALTLLATLISSATSVITRQLVKAQSMSGMQITTGNLLMAMPLFFAATLIMEPDFALDNSFRALSSLVYLGLIGTGVGFTLYYYLLKRVSANRLSLIALITPITGLCLSSWLNNEPMVTEVWIGAALVCVGLTLYEFKPRLGLRTL